MSPEQIEVERKAFEAWAKDHHWSIARMDFSASNYKSSATQDAWLGYRARAEKAHRVREALEFYARNCDATETSPCGYEGDLCCKVARAALKD